MFVINIIKSGTKRIKLNRIITKNSFQNLNLRNLINKKSYSINQVIDLRKNIRMNLENNEAKKAIILLEESIIGKEYEGYVIDLYNIIFKHFLGSKNILEALKLKERIDKKNIKANKVINK